MKFLKIIGTVFSSLLSAVLIFALVLSLTVSLTVVSTARAINEKTIQNAMLSVLQNEEVREELSQEISIAALSAAGDYIRKSFKDPAQAEKTIKMLETYAPMYLEDILSTPAVQEFIGSVASDYALATLNMKDFEEVSMSEKLDKLVSENPAMIDEKIERILKDQKISEETARKNIESFAAKNKIKLPENYTSYSDLIAQTVTRYESQIDKSSQGIIEKYLPFLKDIVPEDVAKLSYETANYPSPMLAAHLSFLGFELTIDEEQSPIETAYQILKIFTNPMVYLLLAVL